VETVEFRQVLLVVMLESAKDRVLGVDTPGQQVLPHVLYGTACLLISDVVGCESCSEVWGKTQACSDPQGARGARVTRKP
jgi:hypothetical protein